MARVGVYIDGFNLYHAIAALNRPWLKWTNLRLLCQTFVDQRDNLHEVNLFTTLCSWDASKRKRHLNYVKANQNYGVVVHMGKFYKVTKNCKRHDRRCPFHEEKYTDVAISASILVDAHADRFDKIVLLTADSDQVPTFTAIRRLFPDIELTLALPPGRHTGARELGALAHRRIFIDAGRLEACLLPRLVVNGRGKKVAEMPDIYIVQGCPLAPDAPQSKVPLNAAARPACAIGYGDSN